MSTRDSGYERIPLDLYETPEWVTQVILPEIASFYLKVWEPAAGGRKMSKALEAAGKTVISTDVADEHYAVDFLAIDPAGPLPSCDAIITNPPYSKATEFIEKALAINPHMVAMLLSSEFDFAKSRRHLFADEPRFAKKIQLTKRIVWFDPPPGQKKSGPSANHAWYVWQRDHQGPHKLDYYFHS